ncbi:MAG: preprotein translocase subunit YajC [Rickettsiales bacterium]|jgi:preprotein translocase subunit YajC|nr:preprotein translocase subunit YajC [Rickettsiales bacterium]
METAEVVDVIKAVPQPQDGGIWGIVVYAAVVMGVIYILFIMPQKKRMREYDNMLSSLKEGDAVIAGGLHGKIKKINEKTFDVEVARGVVVTAAKNAVIKE